MNDNRPVNKNDFWFVSAIQIVFDREIPEKWQITRGRTYAALISGKWDAYIGIVLYDDYNQLIETIVPYELIGKEYHIRPLA